MPAVECALPHNLSIQAGAVLRFIRVVTIPRPPSQGEKIRAQRRSETSQCFAPGRYGFLRFRGEVIGNCRTCLRRRCPVRLLNIHHGEKIRIVSPPFIIASTSRCAAIRPWHKPLWIASPTLAMTKGAICGRCDPVRSLSPSFPYLDVLFARTELLTASHREHMVFCQCRTKL